jgi:hypothetical protein
MAYFAKLPHQFPPTHISSIVALYGSTFHTIYFIDAKVAKGRDDKKYKDL